MYDEELLKLIISARCILFVGSGVSADLGYPTWAKLAELVTNHVYLTNSAAHKASYERFFAQKKFAELFGQAEIDLGSRTVLIDYLKTILKPETGRSSQIYELLAQWPFPLYLTTNFDDEINTYLRRHRKTFVTLRNRPQDMAQLRHDASNLIVKLHSDLDHPDEAIVTSKDYHNLMHEGRWQYLRTKLQAIFSIFDIIFIGHSLSDPDLQLLLGAVREAASPTKPIYMIIADATPADAREFDQNYNIRLIPYKTPGGSHHELKRLLKTLGYFIPPREYVPTYTSSLNQDEIEAASSLLLFRTAQTAACAKGADDVLLPLILRALPEPPSSVSLAELLRRKPLSLLANSEALQQAIASLLPRANSLGLVAEQAADAYVITPLGSARVTDASAERHTQEETALAEFEIGLKDSHPTIPDHLVAKAKSAFQNALITMLAQRGLDLANVVLAHQPLATPSLPNLFCAISSEAAQFDDPDVRLAFISSGTKFLASPSSPQRKYLTSLSQGYFLYHLAGLDPTCARLRANIFQQTAWLLDASVFLPFLAEGSQNSEYANDLLAKLAQHGARVFTTDRMIDEAWTHFDWARKFVKLHQPHTAEFLAHATTVPDNLFIDGYIRLAADGVLGTFDDYVSTLFKTGVSKAKLQAICEARGITPLTLDSIKGYSPTHRQQLPNMIKAIRQARQDRGTYRSTDQVEAEAEILLAIQNLRLGTYHLDYPAERVFFVSQSRILDAITPDESKAIVWTPEALYRYLISLPGAEPDPALLHECMLNDFFYAGVTFFDTPRYLKFFGPAVSQAKTSFEDQKARYLAATQTTHLKDTLDKQFERTPDLKKPFFVSQMMWKIAQHVQQDAEAKAATADAKVHQAKKEVEQIRKERDAAIKAKRTAEHETHRLRNLKDPKRQRKLARRARKKRRSKK